MRDLIFIVIENFYKKAIDDVLIGYHFSKFQNPTLLAHHLERITTFWEMQLTGQATKPLEGESFRLLFTHLQLNLKRGELGRWIVLFHQTLDEMVTIFEAETQNHESEELSQIKMISHEWKKRISLFEERFLSHPMMFNKRPH